MDALTRLINSFITIISSVFFIAVLIVIGSTFLEHFSAMNAKFWMASPTTYNVHMVDIRSEGNMDTTTCWLIEQEDHQFHSAIRNVGKNCAVPDTILQNWEDHGKNYRSLNFKFWGGNLVLFVIGSFVLGWLPVRVMGFNIASVVTTVACISIMAVFVGFFTIQDVRAAYAPPKTWRATYGGKIYDAEVKFYLKDKHGQVYYWSAGGTADAYRVPTIGQPANDVPK